MDWRCVWLKWYSTKVQNHQIKLQSHQQTTHTQKAEGRFITESEGTLKNEMENAILYSLIK
jgi:hypothetical protein